MIVSEFYMTRQDGVNLYRSYSDEGFYIERDGVRYECMRKLRSLFLLMSSQQRKLWLLSLEVKYD